MNRHGVARLSTLVIGSLLASLAGARTADAQPQGDRWQFVLAPYVWAAALDGTMEIKGLDADIDISASRIIDHLDFAYMGMFAARKGDWGLTGDAVWVDLGGDTRLAKVDPALAIATVQELRSLSPYADLTFGARYSRLEGRIEFKPPINAEVERTKDWVDPVVGVVLKTTRERRWHATLIADVGGTGGSDKTWQVFPSIGFKMSRRSSFEVGYRFLGTDYASGTGSDRIEYDVVYKGAATGLAFRF